MTPRSLFHAAIAIALALGAALFAQQPQDGVGRSVWDGVYTEGQADRGHTSYLRSCAKCHALGDDGVPRRFTGDAFWADWGEDTLDSLYSVVRKSMPNDSPGSLSEATYADIIAFLLQANAVPSGAEELEADAVSTIRVLTRDSDGRMPAGAFVSVSGCLSKSAGGWTITRATEPARYRGGDGTRDSALAAAQPAGSAVFHLLFVLSALDKIEGHTVLVRGLLVRSPADAINVTSVQSVATNCQL